MDMHKHKWEKQYSHSCFYKISIFHFTVEAHSYRKQNVSFVPYIRKSKNSCGENIVPCQQSGLNVRFHGDLISCNCHSRLKGCLQEQSMLGCLFFPYWSLLSASPPYHNWPHISGIKCLKGEDQLENCNIVTAVHP